MTRSNRWTPSHPTSVFADDSANETIDDDDVNKILSSHSLLILTDEHRKGHPLLQYCRTGQWQCILDYFHCHHSSHYSAMMNTSSSSSSAGMDSDDIDRMMINIPEKNTNIYVDDRCLQYIIRSTLSQHRSNHIRSGPGDDDDHDHDNNMNDTTTSIVVRQQLHAIETLLQHHPLLISVIHPLTGTILHEAIQYQCHYRIIQFLFQQMMIQQQRPQSPPQSPRSPQLWMENDRPYQNDKNLFQVQDDIGRTILHCFIGRWQRHGWPKYGPAHGFGSSDRDDGSSCTSSTSLLTLLFRSMVRAFPPQISIPDFDGYTPLLQLLQTTTTTTPPLLPTSTSTATDPIPIAETREDEMYKMIHWMVQYQPNVVFIPKRIPYHTYQLPSPPPHHRHYPSTQHVPSSSFPASSHRPNPKSGRTGQEHPYHQQHRANHNDHGNMSSGVTYGDGNAIHAPLFYALLYGRSKPTIQLLLDTYRQIHTSSCGSSPYHSTYSSLILSQYREVALHIAITTSASVDVLQCIVQDCPSSTVLCKDLFQLTPMDWVWLVYVREYYNLVLLQHHSAQHADQRHHHPNDLTDPAFQHLVTTQRLRQIISRRRHLSDHIVQWHHSISAEQQQRFVSISFNGKTHSENVLPLPTDHHEDHSDDVQARPWFKSIQSHDNDLFCRLNVLLPPAASTLWQEQQYQDSVGETSRYELNPFDTETKDTNLRMLLHAACYVPCPVTVIQFIALHLYNHRNPGKQQKPQSEGNWKRMSDHHPLQYRDNIAWRYPLHYAATRVSYYKTLPIGFTISTQLSTTPNGSHVLQEDLTPVQVIAPLYPMACTQRDAYGQLPLHIVIDTYKRYRCIDITRLQCKQPFTQSVTRTTEHIQDDCDTLNFYDNEEDMVIQLLIQLYPPSIHMRDGRTLLYPYQQAAAASVVTSEKNTTTSMGSSNNDKHGEDDHGCRLSTIYQLLRFNPTLIN